MGNNNKDSYQLLAMYTSDSASDTPELVISPKKKKLKRKQRNIYRTAFQNNSSSVVDGLKCCKTCGGCAKSTTARLIITTISTAMIICWIGTLTYLAFVLNAEIQHLDTTIQRVVAGNQGVPDALQKCHSISRELQKNQTALFNSLIQLSQQLAKFNSQVVDIRSGLTKVEDQFKATPELVNVASLSNSVATFGSQIRDLELTTKHIKESNTKLVETTNVFQKNITSLKQKISELESAPLGTSTSIPDSDLLATLSSTVNSLKTNLTNINSTLSEKLQWALDDETKHNKLIETLQDTSANISARVTTLRDECSTKTNQIAVLSNNVNTYKQEMDSRFVELSSHVTDIQGMCNRIQNSTSNLENVVNNIKNSIGFETNFPSEPTIPDKLKSDINNSTEI